MPSVLVAEDDEGVRIAVRRILEGAGYEVCEAANGVEAIDALCTRPFDLVITDIFMPERDGLETIMHVRKKVPDTRVIAISGSQNELFLSSARGLGAAHTLHKPFRPHQLLELVTKVLA